MKSPIYHILPSPDPPLGRYACSFPRGNNNTGGLNTKQTPALGISKYIFLLSHFTSKTELQHLIPSVKHMLVQTCIYDSLNLSNCTVTFECRSKAWHIRTLVISVRTNWHIFVFWMTVGSVTRHTKVRGSCFSTSRSSGMWSYFFKQVAWDTSRDRSTFFKVKQS
jgi:hypothetical protein